MTQFWIGVVIGATFYGAILGVLSIADDAFDQAIVEAKRLTAHRDVSAGPDLYE